MAQHSSSLCDLRAWIEQYMKAEAHRIKREDYQKNIEAKMQHIGFIDDVKPLLRQI